MQIKNVFGKILNDNEINDLKKASEDKFLEELKNKFFNKRKNRIKLFGTQNAFELEKRIFLQLIDQNWKTHIQYLEHLRQVVGLRSYGQRDPLVEYKKESFTLFKNMLDNLKINLIRVLSNLEIVENSDNKTLDNEEREKNLEKIASKKIGRNEPCPCNSGKKYKHCCGAL